VVPLMLPRPQGLKTTSSTSPEPPTNPVCRIRLRLPGHRQRGRRQGLLRREAT
jgi:hypothetical protein